MYYRGKRYSVLGAGRSGLAAVRLLLRRRAKVFVSESASEEKMKQAADELRALQVDAEFGGHTHRVLDADIIITSPGIASETPILELARRKEIPIIGELELASDLAEAPIVAITGTNGKTTTTMLTAEIFRRAGWQTAAAGNIGTAFSDVVESITGDNAVFVLEVSSFQLDTIKDFRPKVSAILNITPDHLDRYTNYEQYVQSKFRIVENQKGHDVFVYNYDDVIVRNLADTVTIRTYGFSLTDKLRSGAYLEDGSIILRIGREREVLMPAAEVGIPGPHNLMNAMAAALMARSMGIAYDVIAETLRSFKGVEHRIEFVRELDGIRYYNDSKATNVESLRYALQSFSEPIILIAGGVDKGNDYSVLSELVKDHVKAIITIGKGAAQIEKSLAASTKIIPAGDSLEKAVSEARRTAEKGDVILLSPACASFDMFDNYEHRGKMFKQIVHNLPKDK
jgi:UDP-N-acetylmuramoylalanine--D-glutamate ligase